jgi:murein DD-endopeptidase MepM/ murein hydrolase activator NlpD
VFQAWRAGQFGFFLCCALCCLTPQAWGEEEASREVYSIASSFPLISTLNSRDTVFKQLQKDIEAARIRVYGGSNSSSQWPSFLEGLSLYRYTVQDEDYYDLYARCSVGREAIVTLNHLDSPAAVVPGLEVLIPSVPGLYIPQNPKTDLEKLLFSNYSEAGPELAIPRGSAEEVYRFIPGATFNATEWAFFLNPKLFHFPLKDYVLTDDWGMRTNPITGTYKLHEGLDLAAALGSPVYAARDGTVLEIGEDAVYGKYIIVQHNDNWVSLYGHLSEIDTVLKSSVKSTTIIGKVGTTGQSTGPHLHFEVRQYGKAQNPGKYLFKEGS